MRWWRMPGCTEEFRSMGCPLPRSENAGVAVNVRETEHAYVLEVAAPGMQKKDFAIRVDGTVLIIEGTEEREVAALMFSYRRQEFTCRSFVRTFHIPEDAQAAHITARYHNGVLRVVLPKRGKPSMRCIEVG